MINRPDSVIALEDGSFLVRGYVSDDEAVEAIRREYSPDFVLDRFCTVERRHVRAMPAAKDMPYDIEYRESEPGRGAFPVTAIWI